MPLAGKYTHSGPEPGIPDLRFRVWVMDNQSLERHMQERNIDFALVQLPVQNANYAMLPLARQEFVAVYGQGFPRPRHDPSALRN